MGHILSVRRLSLYGLTTLIALFGILALSFARAQTAKAYDDYYCAYIGWPPFAPNDSCDDPYGSHYWWWNWVGYYGSGSIIAVCADMSDSAGGWRSTDWAFVCGYPGSGKGPVYHTTNWGFANEAYQAGVWQNNNKNNSYYIYGHAWGP